jgi:hypothetical protein
MQPPVDLFEKDPGMGRPSPTNPRGRLGASGWACPDWVGPFYPAGTPPRNFPARACHRFDAVKIDSAFADNRFHGHGPVGARALVKRLAGNPPSA